MNLWKRKFTCEAQTKKTKILYKSDTTIMISKDEVEKSCDYYEDLKILEKKTFYHADDVMSCDDDEQFFSNPTKNDIPCSHTP